LRMKAVSLLLSLLISLSYSYGQKKQSDNYKGRFEKSINSQWTFNYFSSESADKGYELPGFDDSRWPAISLPHSWNSYETTGELRPFAKSPGETGDTYWWTGWGWYRKHFSISSDYADIKVFIEFEGVQKYCKVWVNGKYAGDHKGGYGSFDFDITGFIKAGEDNLIAVAVSNLQKDEFSLHSLNEGLHNVSCGIYRGVRIVLKNKLFIPMQGSAAHEGGTFISFPKVSDAEGVVNVKTWVKNEFPQSKACLLQTTITDKNSQVVQVIRTEAVINPDQLYMFDQTSKPVKNPHLWSAEDPYLYTFVSEVFDKKDVVDSYRITSGFRKARADEKDHSLYLNDRKTKLTGFNRHQECPWLGDAVPDWMTEMDYSGISVNKRINFLRTVNYPANSEAFNQADLQGLLTSEDFSGVINHMFTPEEQKQQIREMIRRDRNHPSLVAWSVGDDPGKNVNSVFAASEDTTRNIGSLKAAIDTSSTYFDFSSVNNKDNSPSAVAGEAARIILTSSHNRISADRGSVALIKADITDADGNHVSGARNTISWRIAGPAKLVGPSYYVSYADSNHRADEGWYIRMPATNIIRSTGVPGKIKVTVFSSGLASGSVEINAEEIAADKQVLNEPLLSDQGRKPVSRTSLVTARLEEIPVEIAPASDDIKIAATGIKEFGKLMKDNIKKNNPSVDSASFEFSTLIAVLAKQLSNNAGTMSAADYNFNAGHYNTCRLISGYISKTRLPPLFKESMRQYYSALLITQGCEKNAGDEMNWLNWIPSGGVVVIVPDEKTSTTQKGVIYSKQDGLQDIIKLVYPQFAKFSDDARQRALIYISRMNPSVRVTYSINGSPEPGNLATYTAEKGKPILIPEFKFISE
jgi:hypothetical protein